MKSKGKEKILKETEKKNALPKEDQRQEPISPLHRNHASKKRVELNIQSFEKKKLPTWNFVL